MFGITLVTFVVLRVLPGDPLAALIDERAAGMDQETIDRIREQWRLDEPLPVQYGQFLADALRGDLGRSFRSRQDVSKEILGRLPATALLAAAAMLVAVVAGLLLGMLAAVRRGTWLDSTSMVGALSGLSVPVFWLALIFQYVFSVRLGALPASGYGELRHLVMPAVVLAAAPAAVIARITRSAMLEVVGSDYVTTARAKGLKVRIVVFYLTLKNAAIPSITLMGDEAASLLNGAVVIETLFGWPGIGILLIQAIERRDLPLVESTAIVIAVMIVGVNLLVDLTYSMIDPRVRYQ
jgi:ABC-type dipeptide/oligopeptide/nickel transport system permease component